jgi:hypothetical protein
VFEWKVAKVEIDTFGHHIGSKEQYLIAEVDNSSIVARSLERRIVALCEALRETVDKAKLTQCSNLSTFSLTHSSILKIFAKLLLRLESCKKKYNFATNFFETDKY